jgi:hypothetical protein
VAILQTGFFAANSRTSSLVIFVLPYLNTLSNFSHSIRLLTLGCLTVAKPFNCMTLHG